MTNLILPIIDQKKCILCGDCVDACPEDVLELDNGQLVFIRPEACTYCTACEAVCPTNAVRCAYEIRWKNI